MNKKAAIAEIIRIHGESEIARLELIKLRERADMNRTFRFDIERIQRHFEVDIAFRNGMAQALHLLGVLDDDDKKYLLENTHIPKRLLGIKDDFSD